tara:strand:- start:148 stop:312 length:165 start_codon:yes stop_codon:yes gene_type:complete
MTLLNADQKLTRNELHSIENAVEDVGIRAIHPNRMEAFAAELVERLKNTSEENK